MAEDLPTEIAEVMARSGTQQPGDTDELVEKLKAALTYDYADGGDNYNKGVEAMKQAAVAAFNWAAHSVGASGFQASMAALAAYAEIVGIDGPFIVMKAEEALYPQYDQHAELTRFIDEQRDWLREQARQRLAERADSGIPAHRNVEAHWRELAV